MSCLLCVDATEPCPRLAPAGESARSPFWFSRDISRRSAGGEKIDPRVRMGQVRTQVSTGLQISRPRAFRGPFGLGKALQKATSRHSTTHRALFTAMSAFTVASNLTSRVALPKARAARRTARRAEPREVAARRGRVGLWQLHLRRAVERGLSVSCYVMVVGGVRRRSSVPAPSGRAGGGKDTGIRCRMTPKGLIHKIMANPTCR